MPGYLLPMLAAAVAVAAAGPVRAAVYHHSVAAGQPWRTRCWGCDAALVGDGWRFLGGGLRPSGRCAHCGAAIGPRYALVEILTAAVCAALAWRSGAHPSTLALIFVAVAGVALAFIDLRAHRLPDRLVGAAGLGAAVILAVASAVSGDYRRLGVAALCALGAGAFGLVLALTGMGLGDAKLAVVVGFVAGWSGVRAAILALLAGVLLGGVAMIVLLAIGRTRHGAEVAYGPFLLLGLLTAVLLHG